MKQSEIKEWCAALRSGDYKQGLSALTSIMKDGTKEHCCLGVWCVLKEMPADDHLFTSPPNDLSPRDIGDVIYTFPDGDKSTAIWSDEYLTKMQITEIEQYTLTRMNDTGKSFNEIALWIEANIKPTEE